MAITNNGTILSISTNQIPTGFTAPVVTTFTDAEYVRSHIIDVLRVTVANADKAITLTNIMTNATIGINKQVTDILTADYVGTNTVQAYSEVTSLTHNIQSIGTTDFLGNAVVVYRCAVKTA